MQDPVGMQCLKKEGKVQTASRGITAARRKYKEPRESQTEPDTTVVTVAVRGEPGSQTEQRAPVHNVTTAPTASGKPFGCNSIAAAMAAKNAILERIREIDPLTT